jgi:hypothetical protein
VEVALGGPDQLEINIFKERSDPLEDELIALEVAILEENKGQQMTDVEEGNRVQANEESLEGQGIGTPRIAPEATTMITPTLMKSSVTSISNSMLHLLQVTSTRILPWGQIM